MKETTEKLLQINDESFKSDYFDFDLLRREGLKHIGDLSGKIWTDHNVHDPGITILEMLCYALLDLGYRTELDIADLIANKDGENNSFFTPAEILTNNPTTILDYRKLLIEIDGVQNAWLIPKVDYELSINCDDKSSAKQRVLCNTNENPSTNIPPFKFCLNGLYEVLIQKEESYLKTDEELISDVKEKLNAHRNLCEDFCDIKILCNESIGICGDIEIENNVDPEKVYIDILKAVEKHLSPRVKFHTLQDLLVLKMPIETIFEGRPYDPEYSSPGFIINEELEGITLKKEIYLSDLYALINQIDGVNSIKDLKVTGFYPDGGQHVNMPRDAKACGDWVFKLAQDHVPVFKPEKSCINLLKDGSLFKLDKYEIERLKSQNTDSGNSGRAKGNKSFLDIEPPKGTYRPDLDEYYSIQNDFPSVYGIGEGGLSNSVTDVRKAQAYQLKGYLLFFDQLLVNYLSNLKSFSSLLSFRSQAENKTNNANLNSVPDLEKLLQSVDGDDLKSVSLVPVSSETFENNLRLKLEDYNPHVFPLDDYRYNLDFKSRRDYSIQQLIREIQQENFEINIYATTSCYYFTFEFSSIPITLVANSIYQTKSEALTVANNIAYVGSLEENYKKIDKYSKRLYSFNLEYKSSNGLIISDILAMSELEKSEKRDMFLDHLLARFSESFTDFSLVVFNRLKDKKLSLDKMIELKTNYLNSYPELSSNRGKAFDYTDKNNIWDTENISGLERKAMALTGVEDQRRKYLCNFEVHRNRAEFQVIYKYGDKLFFKTKNVYDSFENAEKVCQRILNEAKNNSFYGISETKNCYFIDFNGTVSIESLMFDSREERDKCLNLIRNLFSKSAAIESNNIYPVEYHYNNVLINSENISIVKSSKNFLTEEEAKALEKSFISKIGDQKELEDHTGFNSSKLISQKIGDINYVANVNLISDIVRVTDSEYRWTINDNSGKVLLHSCNYFSSEESAFKDYVRVCFDGQKKWVLSDNELQLLGMSNRVLVNMPIKDINEGQFIIDEASLFLNDDLVENSFLSKTGEAFGFELRNPAGRMLLESKVLYKNKNILENKLESFNFENYRYVINDKNKFVIEFVDENKRTIASSQEAFDDPDDILKQITSNRDALKITRLSQTFSFVIKDKSNSGILLEGFTKYKSRGEAYAALFKFTEGFKSENFSFKKVGEQELGNLELFVVDDQEQYLAFSPKDNIRNTRYWNKEKNTITKVIKALEVPLGFTTESKFILCYDKKELFSSSNYFSDKRKAKKAGQQAVFNFLSIESESKLQSSVMMMSGSNKLFNEFDLTWVGNAYSSHEQALTQATHFYNHLKQNSFRTEVVKSSSKFKFQYNWINPQNEIEILLQSDQTFDSWELANTKYSEFKANAKNLKYNIIEIDDQFGFEISSEDQGFKHDKTYASKSERAAVINFAKKQLEYFIDPRADDSCVQLTERSLDENNFVYRTYDKGNPLAIHPCSCYFPSNDNQTFELSNTLNYLCERQYMFPEVCFAISNVVRLVDGRYKYVFSDSKNSSVCLISIKDFGSKDDAYKAFKSEYLKVVHYGSLPEMYYVEDNRILIGPSNKSALVERVLSKDEVAETVMINLKYYFENYPIRMKAENLGSKCDEEIIKGFYFQLRGDEKRCGLDWISAICYDKIEEAVSDFNRFKKLIENKVNYRTTIFKYLNVDWINDCLGERKFNASDSVSTGENRTACCELITINEVFLESCIEYQSEDCAWGEHNIIATLSPEAFINLEEACVGLDNFNPLNFKSSIRIDSKINGKGTPLFYYSFILDGMNIDDGSDDSIIKFISNQTYESADAARSAAQFHFTNDNRGLKEIKSRLKIILDDDCLYRIVMVHPEIIQKKIDLPDCFLIDPCNNHLLSQKGMERMLSASCDDDNYVIINNDKSRLPYSFVLVEKDEYYFAKLPNKYHSKDDLKLMCDWIFKNLKGRDLILDCVEKDGEYFFKLNMGVGESLSDKNLVYNVNSDQPFNLEWTYDVENQGEHICLLEMGQSWKGKKVEGDEATKLIIEQANQSQALKIKRCLEKALAQLLENRDNIFCDGKALCISIINPNGVLAYHPTDYNCLEDLEAAIIRTKRAIHTEGLHLLEHILLRPEQLKSLTSQIETLDCSCTLLASADKECILEWNEDTIENCDGLLGKTEFDYMVGADPYSFLASVMLPHWSKNYKDENFRSYLNSTLLKEAPSHVALNVLWLGARQFCKFEDNFREWLSYKAGETICQTSVLCDLIECLLELKSKCYLDASSQDVDCSCDEKVRPLAFQLSAVNAMVGLNANYDNIVSAWSNNLTSSMVNFSNFNSAAISNIISTKIDFDKQDFVNWSADELLINDDLIQPIAGTFVGDALGNPAATEMDIENFAIEEETNTKETLKPKPNSKPKSKKSIKSIPIVSRTFLSDIKSITDKNILKTKTYKLSLSLATKISGKKITKNDIQKLDDLVSFNLRYALGKKGGVDDQKYIELLANVVAIYLDKLAQQDRKKVLFESQLLEVVSKMKSKSIDVGPFHDVWNPSDLAKLIKNKVIVNKYSKLLNG